MLTSLPLLIENKFLGYVTGNYSGAYNVYSSFSTNEVSQPCITVECGKLTQLEPGTDVYRGNLTVCIYTQADDALNAINAHDQTFTEMYSLLTQNEALAGLNGGATFNMWGYYIEYIENQRSERSFKGSIELVVNCQSLGVS